MDKFTWQLTPLGLRLGGHLKCYEVEASITDIIKRVCICLVGVIARDCYPCKEKQILRKIQYLLQFLKQKQLLEHTINL